MSDQRPAATSLPPLPPDQRPRVLIVGAGATGSELARRLLHGWHVALLEQDLAGATAALTAHVESGSIALVEGDASSRLVLERAGAAHADAVVVATGAEDVTYEVCRILKEDLHHPNVAVVLRSEDRQGRFHALGAKVVLGFEASAALLASAVTMGSRIAAGVGLGRGEVMETEILPNSSVLGKPLSHLRPRRWLVAAVYRADELIVPHGDTRLAAGDRVLLVGDPEVLPSVARFLRTGHSEFPLHYGSAIVAPINAVTETALGELAYLARNTKAEVVEFVTCGAGDAPRAEYLARWSEAEKLAVRFGCAGQGVADHLAGALARGDVGILVQGPEPLPFLRKLGVGWSPLMRRIAAARSPVLVARGTVPYRRILLAVTEPELDGETATLAIDAARNFGATLAVGIAVPPEFVTGAGHGAGLRRARDEIRELAGTYDVRTETLEAEGNPADGVLAMSASFQLVVVGFRTARRNSLGRPSVEQQVVHGARCSVLVLPR
ncbi:MAG: NAD-binding protein [Deltaproteobacteria bacterium]|nr:NAD-binding protein [Deltaproteobacteria bacterium]